MGYANTYECKKCGKSGEMYLDVGMMYPETCETAKVSALCGKMGRRWQQFVSEHPVGVFDCEYVVFSCTCGGWRVGPKLDYYVAEDDRYEFSPYFTGDDNYPGEIKRSQHRCPKCRKNMHVVPADEIPSLRCPDCGGELDILIGAIMWD